jgi:hypothetical protein
LLKKHKGTSKTEMYKKEIIHLLWGKKYIAMLFWKIGKLAGQSAISIFNNNTFLTNNSRIGQINEGKGREK